MLVLFTKSSDQSDAIQCFFVEPAADRKLVPQLPPTHFLLTHQIKYKKYIQARSAESTGENVLLQFCTRRTRNTKRVKFEL